MEILAPTEMSRVDRLAGEAGVESYRLMLNAGQAVAEQAMEMADEGATVVVLAGPGNNGGDGFVAAQRLAGAGFRVRVLLLGALAKLSGDAAKAAAGYAGEVGELAANPDLDADLIIDALFGAGLSRDLDGDVAAVVEAANACGCPILSIDLPSGIDGATGQVRGAAIRATATVTFFRLKPAHLLMPGRVHCGELAVTDIGIPSEVLERIGSRLFHNKPELWSKHFHAPALDGHKYDRGHAVVVAGEASKTGAARMAALAALRIGAGLVTVASPKDALPVNAAHLTAVMLREAEGAEGLRSLLEDKRLNAVAIGPGYGHGGETAAAVEACLASGAAVVLDADAITAFRNDPERLFRAIHGSVSGVVLTPHAGEFSRLFPDLAEGGDKVAKTREAARRSGATVLLKGTDTVVASPDGRASISDGGTPWLATAGTGDVLAGLITGILAQKVPAFEAASAAVWIHAAAAHAFGAGLIAEDLPDVVPAVLEQLFGTEPAREIRWK
ncbi:NAD(P)H-hydrate dehydratase [Faunimonas pinastri]|uniref:NAD(P)H-hydrate dehydratase n=1 Tax=Faunimonas pinastri TaxID=1855383 RepID=UPI000B80CB26|nr:NAD(P)H-hydrate dehydratase [Faunimonas pinastri]